MAVYRQLMTGSADEQCSTTQAVCGTGTGVECCRRSTLFMGAQIGAAPGLTLNQGTYYIDTNTAANTGGTTPPPSQPASFQPGQTYALYHLYANTSTQVTYQLYVGTDFSPSTLQWVRVAPHAHDPNGAGLQVTVDPTARGTSKFNATTGVLSVTLDNSTASADYAFLAAGTDPEACFPLDLCQVNSSNDACTVSGGVSDLGLAASLDAACAFWATRTTGQASDGVFLNDCPRGGCIGFSFTLPAGFTPVPYASAGAGLASCYPNQAPWSTGFTVLDTTCAPAPPTAGNFCAPPPKPRRPSSGPTPRSR